MRITIISPYNTVAWDFTTRILSAVLKKQGYETRLLFLPLFAGKHKIEAKELKHLVELSANSDLIGISLMTNFFNIAVQITQALKKNLNIPVIWGGVHPIIRQNECLEYADMICTGEGEEVLVEIMKRFEKRHDINDIPGLGYRIKDRVFINNPRPLIQDLDSLPFPDYECANDYLFKNGSICKIDKNLIKEDMTKCVYSSKEKYSVYHTITSRGCLFSCTYCFNSTSNKIFPDGKKIRKRSIDNIIKELSAAKRTLPFINCVLINDDNFFFRSKEEIVYFAKEYKEKIGSPLWITGLNVLQFNKENFSWLVNAGLRFIRMGIQTGSDRINKMYGRYYSSRQTMAVVKEINKFRDRIAPPSYDFILDNPWESENDLAETLMLLSRLPRPYIIELFSLTLYPATVLYQKAKKEGIIKNDLQEVYNHFYSKVKPTYLNKLFQLIYVYSCKGYYISPKVMFLLINPILRNLKFSYLLYGLLNVFVVLLRLKEVLNKGFHAMLAGDFARISRYLRKFISNRILYEIK